MANDNKSKSNLVYVIILIVSVLVIVGVIAYSISANKRKEREIAERIWGDGALESTMQESLDSMKETQDNIQHDIDEKMNETK